MPVANRALPRRFRYVLGDSGPEARRLERQAELWDPVARALFDRVAVQAGWRVLEIGPGRGSVHLELRKRIAAAADAVERSPAFAGALSERTRHDGLGAGRIWCENLVDAALPSNTYDFIYARWVFCFLPDVDAHVRKLVRALRPGGLLAVQDYAHRESFALCPRPAEWLDFLAADRAFFASQGGDISIGGRLPSIFRRAGLKLTDVTPVQKSGPPGSLVWEWLWEFYRSVRGRYGHIRPLDPGKARALSRRWRAASFDASSFVVAPTMVDVIGRKG